MRLLMLKRSEPLCGSSYKRAFLCDHICRYTIIITIIVRERKIVGAQDCKIV